MVFYKSLHVKVLMLCLRINFYLVLNYGFNIFKIFYRRDIFEVHPLLKGNLLEPGLPGSNFLGLIDLHQGDLRLLIFLESLIPKHNLGDISIGLLGVVFFAASSFKRSLLIARLLLTGGHRVATTFRA
jgi:hypothetical protein